MSDGMNMKRKLFYLLLSLAGLMIWGGSIHYTQYINSNYTSVSVRMPESSITKQDLLTALEHEEIKGTEEIPTITAWKQIEDQRFEYPELATTAELPVIEFWGDMNQIMPIQLVMGSMITSEDDNGCMIDENAAYRLFRTRDAVGRYLTYQDQSYYIRGVIRAKQEVIIISVPEEENGYSNLELVYANKDHGEQYVRDFMQQNALGENYTIVEGCYYGQLIQMLTGLPSWLLGFSILYQLIRERGKRRLQPLELIQIRERMPLQAAVLKRERLLQQSEIQRRGRLLLQATIFLMFFCCVLFLLRWITEFRIVLPERWIPTRWSDFSFWIERWQEVGKHLEELEYLVPVTKDILLFQALRRCIAFSLVALVAAVVLVTHRKVFFAEDQGIENSLIVIALEGIAALCLYRLGMEFDLTRDYLYILPCFILCPVRNVYKR